MSAPIVPDQEIAQWRANAGPSPGDMPMDRFIAALPLPRYDVAPLSRDEIRRQLGFGLIPQARERQ